MLNIKHNGKINFKKIKRKVRDVSLKDILVPQSQAT